MPQNVDKILRGKGQPQRRCRCVCGCNSTDAHIKNDGRKKIVMCSPCWGRRWGHGHGVGK